MAFYSGNFSSFVSLKSSVESALQSNGWSLNSDILSKDGVFVKLTATADRLLLDAGTGAADGALTGAAPNGAKIMSPSGNPINFPGVYDLHVFDGPNEVFLVVNYNADAYQQLSWGKSAIEQVGGTGAWFSGSFAGGDPLSQPGNIYLSAGAGEVGAGAKVGDGHMTLGLFFETTSNTRGAFSSWAHGGLDGTGWRLVATGDGRLMGSGFPVAALLQALPSNFNQNTVLLPVLVTQRRFNGGLTVVVDMANARLCRNDNHLAGEIVAYGPDRWKVYPFHRKNADERNGGSNVNHTGTFAYAIRYTGP